MMHEDFKVVRPSIRSKNPTEKYNVKKDSVPVPACMTSRPKIVSDKKTQSNGAFICVRPKLVQKKKSRYVILSFIDFFSNDQRFSKHPLNIN